MVGKPNVEIVMTCFTLTIQVQYDITRLVYHWHEQLTASASRSRKRPGEFEEPCSILNLQEKSTELVGSNAGPPFERDECIM